MLKVGTPAPDFTVPLGSGEQFTLSDYRGKNVVLYFYPKAFTLSCSLETKVFRRAYDEFLALNAIVIGVGPESVATTEQFKASCEAPFPMGSDPSGEVRRQYDVARRFNLGTSRVTYVIDSEAVIRGVFHEELIMSHHVGRALQAVANLA